MSHYDCLSISEDENCILAVYKTISLTQQTVLLKKYTNKKIKKSP